MRVKNPATVQMIRDIIEGNTPPARVPECENAANVTESIGGAPLAEIFAADGATRGVSEILLVADLADTAFGALHPITGKNAAVRVCVEQGVIMVYTGENARTPTNCAVSVRKLFD